MNNIENGRVNTIKDNNFTPYSLFKEKKTYNSLLDESIKNIHQKNNLNQIYFSQDNINALQQGIRYLVYKKSCGKYIIDNQSETELGIIMRSVYLQYGEFREYGLLEQIKELNQIVLNYCVDKILQEIKMYIHYKNDISKLPEPISRGEFISSKGTKVLEIKNFY